MVGGIHHGGITAGTKLSSSRQHLTPFLPSRSTSNSKLTYCSNNATFRLSCHPSRTSTSFLSPRSSLQYTVSSQRYSLHDSKMGDAGMVLEGKYPAKAHAKRVVEYIKKKKPNASGILYLEGQKTRMIEDNDETMPFR